MDQDLMENLSDKDLIKFLQILKGLDPVQALCKGKVASGNIAVNIARCPLKVNLSSNEDWENLKYFHIHPFKQEVNDIYRWIFQHSSLWYFPLHSFKWKGSLINYYPHAMTT